MMKTLRAAAVMLALATTAAMAAPVKTGGLPACGSTSPRRVALTMESAPCCAATLACPRLLANTGLDKAKRPNRT